LYGTAVEEEEKLGTSYDEDFDKIDSNEKRPSLHTNKLVE
jgi:hypothetical protein